MTLHVPFDQFAKTVTHFLSTKDVFVSAQGFGSLLTAAQPEKGLLIVCHADSAPTSTKEKLVQDGMTCFEGAWKLSDDVTTEEEGLTEAYIAAVSYKSGESMPGVWVDAHRTLPSQVQVLRVMYDEFRETGELPEVSFEEFVRLSEPNVVIVSPHEIQRFVDRKGDC